MRPVINKFIQGREPYRFPYHKNLKIWAEFPKDWDPNDRRAALICFHGGGFASGTPNYLMPQCRYFAMRGCVCFTVEYTLARDGHTIPEALADAKCAIRRIRKNAGLLGIDPARLMVLGESAGAYLAAAAATEHTIDHPSDDLSISPVPDLIINVNGDIDLTAKGNEGYKELFPDGTTVEYMRSISPLYNVCEGLPPMLAFHGERDVVVDIRNSFDIVREWKAHGNTADMMICPNANHAFMLFYEPESFNLAYKATLMLDDYLTEHGYISK